VPPSSLAQLRHLTPPGRPGGSTGVNPEMGAMDGAVPPSSLAQLRQFTDDKERLCFFCRFQQREARHMQVVAAMLAEPWATPWDLRQQVADLTSREYGLVRGLILGSLWRDLQHWLKTRRSREAAPAEVKEKAHQYCEMRGGRPRAQLDAWAYEHYLGKKLREALGL
ncbi:MAG: hypothetical protein ACYCW6_32370, partial [Candidatus Xenobia bacterium]